MEEVNIPCLDPEPTKCCCCFPECCSMCSLNLIKSESATQPSYQPFNLADLDKEELKDTEIILNSIDLSKVIWSLVERIKALEAKNAN